MLSNSRGVKLKEIEITEEQWKEMLNLIYDGVKRKLVSARMLIDQDNDISAGLFTYALEEFGKLLLLKDSVRVANNTKRKVKYADKFTNHPKKFEIVLNHLQNTGHEYCYVLNNEGSLSPKSFTWKSINLGLIPDFEARTSIFYSDFTYDSNQNVVVQRPKPVERNMLKNAINEFESVVNIYNVTQFY
jgi:hypothetical protein